MTLTAITIEGGLFAPELIEDLAARPDQVEGQRAQDFGLLASARLSDAIQNCLLAGTEPLDEIREPARRRQRRLDDGHALGVGAAVLAECARLPGFAVPARRPVRWRAELPDFTFRR